MLIPRKSTAIAFTILMMGGGIPSTTAEHGGNKRLLMQTRQAITYLASDKASFVTGPILGVNGGKTAS